MKFLACLTVLLTACHAPNHLAPVTAAESPTYLAFAGGGQGTAWAVGQHHLMTAGHVCSTGTAPLKYVAAQSNTGVRFRTNVVEVVYNDFVADLCLLQSDRPLAAPLTIADSMPRPGDPVEYIGYPHGELIHSVGTYEGDVDGLGIWSDYTITAPCNHGASGSAVLHEGRVFGVLVRLIVGEDDSLHDPVEGCVVTPLADIRAMLALHGL